MVSKRKIRKKQCTGKKQYMNRPIAWQAVYAMKRKSQTGLSIYKCSFCNQWHIGHKPTNYKQRRIKWRKRE